MDVVMMVVKYLSMGLAAAIALLAVMAPVTATDWDNKLLDALRWVEDKLMGLVDLVFPGKLPMAKAEGATSSVKSP